MTRPFGIDVSKWQGAMNWDKAVQNGVQFAFVKASEYTTTDAQFERNWAELRRLNMPRGAYIFYRPHAPASQINHFVDTVQPREGERLVLDLEAAEGLNKTVLTRLAVTALEQIKTLTGRYPIVYSRASWLNAYIDMTQIPDVDFWLAQYRYASPWPLFTPEYNSDHLTLPTGVDRWTFHQSGEKGNGDKYGAQSYYIDLNRFNGTLEQMRAYFGTQYQVHLPIIIVPGNTEEKPLYKARVTATDGLRVRECPAITCKQVASLAYNEVVSVYAELNGWRRIGVDRWASADWLERVPETPDLLPVPLYSQRDPRWAGDRMGATAITLGQEGCLVTITAAGGQFQTGRQVTPAMLNAHLTANGGYVWPNLMIWNVAAGLFGLTLREYQQFPSGDGWQQLAARILADGRPAWAQVDFVPGGAFNQHWVLLTGQRDGIWYLYDPWFGNTQALNARYQKIFHIAGLK